MNPLVSVIVPVGPRHDAFAGLAFEAIRRQTYGPLEIVEDARPGKPGAVRNRMNSKATGDIILHWDVDNPCAPDRISKQVARLQEGASVCGSSAYFVVDTRNGATQKVDRFQPHNITLAYWRLAWQNKGFREEVRVTEY